ncbi:hypothetical protein WR25_16158 [Diploscapter pachys]|uniref:Uncharacterized protein n=1 Tax=Diploscapter pachys TaxID=2018661 RepID=A0A2A2JNX1_9BILA|nr:hypothetical protein WR25_16158 [Diploscapter pachys]
MARKTEIVDYGPANYVISRHKKNPVMIWQSRVNKNRVYEFILSSKFKIPGLTSWKCSNCMQMKERKRKEGFDMTNLKIPLVMIDNDIVKENPDRPNNAPHICWGKEAVDVAVKRAKLKMTQEIECKEHMLESGAINAKSYVLELTQSIVEHGPVHLNSMQKRQVKKQIDQHAEPAIKRLKLISEKRKMDNLISEWNPHVINEYIKCDPSCSTDNDDDTDLNLFESKAAGLIPAFNTPKGLVNESEECKELIRMEHDYALPSNPKPVSRFLADDLDEIIDVEYIDGQPEPTELDDVLYEWK